MTGFCDQRVIRRLLSGLNDNTRKPVTCGFVRASVCPRGDLNSWRPSGNQWQPRPQTAFDLRVRAPPSGNVRQQMTREVTAV